MSTTFALVLNGATIYNEENAIEAFEDFAIESLDVDYWYDFDYMFVGTNIDGEFVFDVYVDTEEIDEAYEVMSLKFENADEQDIEIDY